MFVNEINAHFPSLLRNVELDIDLSTSELDFGTFQIHGEPPFSRGTLLVHNNIHIAVGTYFLNIRSIYY
jgi:hypothetical protein